MKSKNKTKIETETKYIESPEYYMDDLIFSDIKHWDENIDNISKGLKENNLGIKEMIKVIDDWKEIYNVPNEVLDKYPALYAIACIKSNGKYNPPNELVADNPKFVDTYFSNIKHQHISCNPELVTLTNDLKLMEDYLKNLNLNVSDKYLRYDAEESVIKAIADKKYMTIEGVVDDILTNKNDYGFNDDDVGNLLSLTNDNDYVTHVVRHLDDYDLGEEVLTYLLIHSVINNSINEPEIYGLTKESFEELLKDIGNVPLIYNYVCKKYQVNAYKMKKLKLPENMTIGIEIESLGELAEKIVDEKNFDGWKAVFDGSVVQTNFYGSDRAISSCELVSPILNTSESDIESIYKMCSFLNTCDNFINETCGGHVHIGSDYLENTEAWSNLVEIWLNTENILYYICNEQGDTPRKGIKKFAGPISNRVNRFLKTNRVTLDSNQTVEDFCKELRYSQSFDTDNAPLFTERFYSINFYDTIKLKDRHIEYRISNGTLNPNVWIENINLFGGLMVASNELCEIEEKFKNGEEITDTDKEKLDAFNTIRTLDNTKENDKVKLDCLLKLAIDESDRQIYIDRYNINKHSDRIVDTIEPTVLRDTFIGNDEVEKINGCDYYIESSDIKGEVKKIKNKVKDKVED